MTLIAAFFTPCCKKVKPARSCFDFEQADFVRTANGLTAAAGSVIQAAIRILHAADWLAFGRHRRFIRNSDATL
jgi:hypothetical protein